MKTISFKTILIHCHANGESLTELKLWEPQWKKLSWFIIEESWLSTINLNSAYGSLVSKTTIPAHFYTIMQN